MVKAKHPGRPPKPAKERKSTTLQVRLNAEQKKLVDKAAAKAGIELSEWVRTAIERAASEAQHQG